MTQEDKELLLIDLCARLPYGVKVQDIYYKSSEPTPIWLIDIHTQNVRMFADEGYQSIEYIKPYLFPLSSMSEEQRKEFDTTLKYLPAEEIVIWTRDTYDWCDKNHFDYRGLIPKGLAIDCTYLNIY